MDTIPTKGRPAGLRFFERLTLELVVAIIFLLGRRQDKLQSNQSEQDEE